MKSVYVAIIFLSLIILSSSVSAAELRLETSSAGIQVGDEVIIDVLVNSLDSLNAIEGSIGFSERALEVLEIRDGNSVINFWIIKPQLSGENKIVFSGITPGGFTGISSRLFSIVFKAKETGEEDIIFEQIKALLNDGLGTAAPVTIRGLKLPINQGDSSISTEQLKDTEAPEYFSIYLSTDNSLFEGKHFIVFATQDKKSGMSHYEAREGKWGLYKKTTSPYLLKDQSLNKDIFVKAVDNAGNEQISVLRAPNGSKWYGDSSIVNLILLLTLACSTLFVLWQIFLRVRQK